MRDPSKNLDIYNKLRAVPQEAKKTISAGRLKGMTDVNPMWRIKALTETFGPVGFGWWYDVKDKRIIEDEATHQKAAFVDIALYVTNPETGEPSKPIFGTGGSSFVANEKNGPYLSDECFKMALTDAISVACKALGMAADVYWQNDKTKYGSMKEPLGDPNTKYICADCGRPVTAFFSGGKMIMDADELAAYTENTYGCHLCAVCAKKRKDSSDAVAG